MSSVYPAISAGISTWKPRPSGGPPSAWIEIAASACASFPIAARWSMHGPQPSLVVRGHHDPRAGLLQHRPEPQPDIEGVRSLGVPVVRLRTRRVARPRLRTDEDRSRDLGRVRIVAAVVAGIDGDRAAPK